MNKYNTGWLSEGRRRATQPIHSFRPRKEPQARISSDLQRSESKKDLTCKGKVEEPVHLPMATYFQLEPYWSLDQNASFDTKLARLTILTQPHPSAAVATSNTTPNAADVGPVGPAAATVPAFFGGRPVALVGPFVRLRPFPRRALVPRSVVVPPIGWRLFVPFLFANRPRLVHIPLGKSHPRQLLPS
eukprot:scaffold7533_cov133-Amphora_coffeaeformis.AAC.1